MGFSPWMAWVVVALVFIIIEIFTTGFAVMCFSFGAVAAAICDACGLGLTWQVIAFAVFTALAFAFIRPLVLKLFFKNPESQIKTNADAIIGRTARVSEAIDPEKGTGRVAVDGDDWKAEAEDGAKIEVGCKVTIIERNGLILKVRNN